MLLARVTSLLLGTALLAFVPCVGADGRQPQAAPSTTFFLSDLHMGIGQIPPGKYANQEDFRWHDEFAALLDYADASTASNAELVFLGDSFELWQSPFQVCRGDGTTFACKTLDCGPAANGARFACTEAEALTRTRHVLKQHEGTISALRAFAQKGSNRIVLVPGNHDAALLLPDVKATVLQAFNLAQDKVQIAATGFWISADKKIFADHGHMFDKVNRYSTWPEPYETRDNGRVMLRPWGEGMVQEFYNQYEELLPTVDNLTDEAAGARLAVDALGSAAAGIALERFLAFLAFDTTLGQKLSSLGEGYDDDDDLRLGEAKADAIPWNVDAIRAGDASRFFAESMPLDRVRETATGVAAQISWADVTDEDIASLCEQRVVLAEYYARYPRQKYPPNAQITPCPQKPARGANLGYAADKILGRDLRNRRRHLESMSTQVARQFDLYVYGHTHSAASPSNQKIKALWTAAVVNTGAFQRTASVDQLRQLAAKEGKPLTQVFVQLTPEKLRPCYPFVRVKPYAADAKPVPQLRWWALADGQWKDHDSCPAWP